MTKIRSCITEENFSNLLNSGIVSNKVTEATTIAGNSWAWNSTYKAVHINGSTATVKKTVDLNIGFIQAGDTIDLNVEFMNISGVKAKVGIDVADNVGFTAGVTNVIIVGSSKTGVFEEVSLSFVARKDGYYKLVIGLFTADIGEFYMRNCKSLVKTKVNTDTFNYKQVIKTGNIKTSATGVFERDTRFGVDDFTITVNQNYLILTFTKPFTHSGARPTVTIGEDSTSGSYRIRTTSQQVTTVTIQMYNSSTNVLVDHTAVPAGVYFSFTAIGYDLI